MASSTSIRTFDVEKIIFNVQRQATLMIGEDIKDMIIKTSNECLPLLRGKIDEFFNAIANTGVDPSPLKSQIEKCMESVDHLDVVQHTHSMKISLEVKKQMFNYCYVSDCDALKSEGVQVNRRQSLKVDLATLDANKKHLRRN